MGRTRTESLRVVFGIALAVLSWHAAQAKTCFLPDCDQRFNSSHTDNIIYPDGSEQGTDKRACSDYGFEAAVPAGYECQAVTPDGKLRCYTGCKINPDVWCPENNYGQSCENGWQPDNSQKCPYDASYFKCCNLCAEYPLSSIPEGYVENGRCESCDGTKYKIKPAPCDGFTTCDYGCELGAEECLSGELTKCSACKTCPNRCTLAACPANNICEYEDCSGKYCAVGCAIGSTDENKYWNGE